MIWVMAMISLVSELILTVVIHSMNVSLHNIWVSVLLSAGFLLLISLLFNLDILWKTDYFVGMLLEKGMAAQKDFKFQKIRTVGNGLKLIGVSPLYTYLLGVGLLCFGVRKVYNMTLKRLLLIPIYSRTK
jgi:hypothetical protein